MSKHTPGPWIVWDMPTKQRYIGPAGDGGAPSVALVLARVNVPDERLAADARLVAAAPDLLEALRAIVALDDGYFPELWLAGVEFDAARAAIAKAEA